MSNPYGMPPAAPRPPEVPAKSRTGLYIGLACGCLLLIGVLVAVIGGGLWLYAGSGDPEKPTSSRSATEDPTDEPTADPTADPTEDPTEEPTEDPLETPSDDPSEDPTSETGSSITLSASAPEEGTTLETSTETVETENGKFVGVAVTITNDGDQQIGLDLDNFTLVGSDSTEHQIFYGKFSTSGPQVEPGEEATALLYVDVPEDTQIDAVTYTDEVGTGGEKVTIPAS